MKNYRPVVFSILVLFLLWGVGILYVKQVESRKRSEHRRELTQTAAEAAAMIEQQLSRSLSATYALSSLLQHYGVIRDFDALAAEMIENYGGISSLQLAPQGIVSKIYPLAGNEKAIGHDLLNDPARRADAIETIKSRKLTLAGPFELLQGGVAVIGRLPVFLTVNDGSEAFWGFTIVLIRLPDLLRASNINTLRERGYVYVLSRLEPGTDERKIFDRSNGSPLISPIDFEFKVPNGKWTLSLAPLEGWWYIPLLSIEYGLVAVIVLAVSILVFLFLQRSETIKLRTTELVKTNKKLIFCSIRIWMNRRWSIPGPSSLAAMPCCR